MNAIHYFDHDDLIMSTACYYLGRRTANVEDFCRRLVTAWPVLSQPVRDYVQRIVEDAFRREQRPLSFCPLGDDCDRASWCKVRACWLSPQRAS